MPPATATTLSPPALVSPAVNPPPSDLNTVEAQQLKPIRSSKPSLEDARNGVAPTAKAALPSEDDLQKALAWAEAHPQTFEELVVGVATPRAIARWQQRRGAHQGLAAHRPSLLQRPPMHGAASGGATPSGGGGSSSLTPPTTVAASRVSLLLYSAKLKTGGSQNPSKPWPASQAVGNGASTGPAATTAVACADAHKAQPLSQGALARAVAAMDSRSDAVLPLLLPLCGAITLDTAVQRVVDDVSILFGSGHCQLFIAQDMGPALPPRLVLMNPKPCNVSFLSFDHGKVRAASTIFYCGRAAGGGARVV